MFDFKTIYINYKCAPALNKKRLARLNYTGYIILVSD